MSRRYFVNQPIVGPTAVLEGAEAHHLLHVMRAKKGAALTLFDGGGAEFAAVVLEISRSQATCQIVERREISRELLSEVVLGAALPKGERQRWLIEKATELGVSRFTPLLTEKSVVKVQASTTARFDRWTLEAAKQCRRNRLMTIQPPLSLEAFAAQSPADAQKWLAHPGGETISPPPPTTAIWLAVGPEGGFTENEVAAATGHGWTTVSLGPRILRIETAAIALAVLAGGAG